ncbi:MAG: phosphoribosylformylglycinamidine synthase subunit PurS [Candidatus Fermentithermobacillus carboniphilus]|uniref:Phosphoribosylformylglycinamidine synthase subunit PurS n=1 Tax=Candidatus Fermentithermobacillus carboniphilus TaxID=3085328 RepID=A0AAT9LDH8_9FIRM|nr:MAG: phosphoribosylformylglycinamidine synthase subunit PurS [Candidatus Fermentithermobacillus carboniphilus]
MKYKGTVVVTLKDGIFDPQGAAVRGSLLALGYPQVVDVRMGKNIVLYLDVPSKEEALSLLDEMARRLLANPVTETYMVSVEEWCSRP